MSCMSFITECPLWVTVVIRFAGTYALRGGCKIYEGGGGGQLRSTRKKEGPALHGPNVKKPRSTSWVKRGGVQIPYQIPVRNLETT